MATITSAGSGNFTNAATWTGGVVPGSGDIAVAANGHTVTINANVTVQEFQQAGSGFFSLGDGRTVTGLVRGNARANGTVEYVGTTSATIIGDAVGSVTTATTSAVGVTGSGTLTVQGNVSGGTQGTARGILSTSGPVVVTGNVTAGPNNNAHGVVTSGASASVTVTGNVTGGTGQNAHGVTTTGNNASRLVTVTGTATAGTGLTAHAIYDTNTSGGWVVHGGNRIDSSEGNVAISTRRLRVIPTVNTYHQETNNTGFPNGQPWYWGSLDYVDFDVPVPADVREGVVYGDGTYTGTLAVPPPASVAAGVPTDDTVGTAAVRLQDVADVVGAQIAAAVDEV
jgi:hypothetical protein